MLVDRAAIMRDVRNLVDVRRTDAANQRPIDVSSCNKFSVNLRYPAIFYGTSSTLAYRERVIYRSLRSSALFGAVPFPRNAALEAAESPRSA